MAGGKILISYVSGAMLFKLYLVDFRYHRSCDFGFKGIIFVVKGFIFIA